MTQTDEEILEAKPPRYCCECGEFHEKGEEQSWCIAYMHYTEEKVKELMSLARQDQDKISRQSEREKLKTKCKRYCKCDCGLHKENGDY